MAKISPIKASVPVAGASVVPFNPLEKKNLGDSIARVMLKGAVHQLRELERMPGAGVYALYYTGPFPAYNEIAKRNAGGLAAAPIYVGKAVPKGARKGIDVGDAAGGRALYGRLREHASSISAAADLDLDDFQCRYLVVDEIFIPLGESALIARYAPVWNTIVDGFGNHKPGGGREKGVRPRWDVLHPGRKWALTLPDRDETAVDIIREVQNYLQTASFPPPP